MEHTLLPTGLASLRRVAPFRRLHTSWLTLAYRPALLTLMLVGFLLRLALLTPFPFREDEAIYSLWALHITRADPLMLTVWPDKPPVFLWLLGGTFSILGAGEAQARFFNVAVSILTVPVLAAAARILWGEKTAVLTALFFVFNPFAISFSATAFTDPLLVLFGALTFHAAVSRRPFWAGVWLALAIMTKQQGILYTPLGFAMAWGGGEAMMRRGGDAERRDASTTGAPRADLRIFASSHHRFSISSPLRLVASLLLGAAVILAPIVLWDAARWQVAPSPWDLSVRNYGGFALAPVTTWPARLAEWGSLLWYIAGNGWVWAAGAVMGVVWGREAKRRRGGEGEAAPGVRSRFWSSPHRLITLSLLLWPIVFLAFHVTTTTQIWDRYLLPLAPAFALGMAAVTARTTALLPGNRLRVAAVVLVTALLLPPAWTAARGGMPIGGDHGGYDGLHQVIDWLESEAPAGSILYHQVLGWHYRFYFFDETAPGDNRFDLRWYPNPVYLADNAAKIGHARRFLVLPEWVSLRNWTRDLAVRRIEATERLRAGRFTLYELTGPPQEYCDWCFSQTK
ncbi:MAG: glycosyltransferase family 39 protein [Caldilineaceae bacterium]